MKTHTPDSSNTFHIEVPGYFNFAYDVTDRRATTDRNRLAMIWLDEKGNEKRITYRDLKIESDRIAAFLHREGIGKGDVVMLMLPRIPEWWYCMIALMKLGAIASPSAVSLMSKDLEYRCNGGNIKMIITCNDHVGKVEQIKSSIPTVEKFVSTDRLAEAGWLGLPQSLEVLFPRIPEPGSFPHPQTRADDPMLIYFTSGTTGYPKMVMHRYSYALAHRATAELWQGITSDDIHWTITDTGWAKAAWGAFFGQWLLGCTIFIYDYRGKFEAGDILRIIEKYGITTFRAPPTAYRLLILEDFKPYRFELKRCVSAGEPLNPEVIEAWHKGTGLEIYEGFGQTETICLIATLPGMEIKYGAMGKPLSLYHIEVLNEDLQPCRAGEEGDVGIRVKPEHPVGIFEGYVGDENTNREVFVGDWYLTGDRAYRDEDGYFWFVGRRDDVIKSSGYRIGPFEVESALIEHPAVIEAAVIGVYDELRGQAVKAFVILGAGYEAHEALADELREHVKNVTAPFKTPKYIEFVTELPKTISGKIRRVELRERERGRS